MERTESSEYHLITEIMRRERKKMGGIVFPIKLANATYKRVDEKAISPALIFGA
jgi:hypothetical protein